VGIFLAEADLFLPESASLVLLMEGNFGLEGKIGSTINRSSLLILRVGCRS
jgi:hypothetical protein